MRISLPTDRLDSDTFLTRARWDIVKLFFLGGRESYGLVFTILLYLLLIAIGFVYLYPLLFMFVTSMKSPADLLNPMVQWIGQLSSMRATTLKLFVYWTIRAR